MLLPLLSLHLNVKRVPNSMLDAQTPVQGYFNLLRTTISGIVLVAATELLSLLSKN